MSFAVTDLTASPSGTPSYNLQEIAGTATSVNNGTADNGTLRVAISSNNSPLTVTQTLGSNLHVNVDNFPATQPVSGTVTALQGTSPWVVSGTITTSPNVNVHDGSGNSISSTSGSLNVDVTNIVPVSQSGAWTNTVIQPTASLLNATVIGTGTFAVQAAQSGIWNITNITGTVSLPTGASTSANQTIANSTLSTISGQLPTTLGTKTVANSFAVNIASDQIQSPTSTVTRVASSATNVMLLASNTSRKAAYLFNESTSIAYVKFGVTASTTSYTIQMVPNAFIVLSQWPIYNGEIDAIWLTANGAMQITELT